MRKFWMNLLLFALLLNVAYGYKLYNSSYSNMSLDANSWCTGMPITFTVYNQTQYLNKTSIQDNLCSGNQTPSKNGCSVFQIIRPKVKVYDGPFDSLPVLYDGQANANGQFTVTFNKSNSDLIELTGVPNFNDYHSPLFKVLDCNLNKKTITSNISSSVNVSKKSNLFNQTFNYNGIVVDLKNTDINSSSSIKVESNLSFSELNLSKVNNTIKLFRVSSTSDNFSSLSFIIPINYSNSSNIKVLKLNNLSKSNWSEISNFQISNKILTLPSASFGTYLIAKKKSIIKNVSIAIATSQTNKVSNSQASPTDLPVATQGNSNLKTYVLGFVFLLVLIYGGFYFKNKMGGSVKKLNSESDVNEHLKNSEVLNSYSEIMSHCRAYVQKYKNSYDKDMIYRALKSANVPSDVIDKVFEEEFRV